MIKKLKKMINSMRSSDEEPQNNSSEKGDTYFDLPETGKYLETLGELLLQQAELVMTDGTTITIILCKNSICTLHTNEDSLDHIAAIMSSLIPKKNLPLTQ